MLESKESKPPKIKVRLGPLSAVAALEGRLISNSKLDPERLTITCPYRKENNSLLTCTLIPLCPRMLPRSPTQPSTKCPRVRAAGRIPSLAPRASGHRAGAAHEGWG